MWSDGASAGINLHVDQGGPVNITIGALAFVPHPGYVQHVKVRVGQTVVATWQFTEQTPVDRTVAIPASLNKTGDIRLDFAFPDATSPSAQHLSADGRNLGLYVSSITVSR